MQINIIIQKKYFKLNNLFDIYGNNNELLNRCNKKNKMLNKFSNI